MNSQNYFSTIHKYYILLEKKIKNMTFKNIKHYWNIKI